MKSHTEYLRYHLSAPQPLNPPAFYHIRPGWCGWYLLGRPGGAVMHLLSLVGNHGLIFSVAPLTSSPPVQSSRRQPVGRCSSSIQLQLVPVVFVPPHGSAASCSNYLSIYGISITEYGVLLCFHVFSRLTRIHLALLRTCLRKREA